MVSTRSVGVEGTKGLVAFTVVSFLAALFFLAGALGRPGTGTLWAASTLWAATGVLAAVRVGVRRRIVSAAAARTAAKRGVQDVREHLIIRFAYGLADLKPLFRMDEELDRVVDASGTGEYDGHEIAVDLSDGSLYFYGPSAAEIRKLIAPTLAGYPFMTGASSPWTGCRHRPLTKPAAGKGAVRGARGGPDLAFD